MTDDPTDHADAFHRRQALLLALFGNARFMNSIIIQRFADVCHSSLEGHRSPEFPIAAEAQAFVRPVDPFVGGFRNSTASRIENGVSDTKTTHLNVNSPARYSGLTRTLEFESGIPG